jgi:hypothetical protein
VRPVAIGSVSNTDPDLDPDSNRSVDPDLESGCGSGQAKTVPRKRRKRRYFMFEEFSVGLQASSESLMSFERRL